MVTGEDVLAEMRTVYAAGLAAKKQIASLTGRISQAEVIRVYDAATSAETEILDTIEAALDWTASTLEDADDVHAAVKHLRTLGKDLRAAIKGLNARCGGHLDTLSFDALTADARPS